MSTAIQKQVSIIQRFNELFILKRKKYLILNNKGKYETKDCNKRKQDTPLTDNIVLDHLEGKRTLGVMSGDYVSKFICFDVDIKDKVKAKHITYRIVDTLINIGISSEYIHISTSGNKGYHIDIYFDNVILNEKVRLLYDLIMKEADLYNLDYGQIELRPTNQGLKLPLGVNFKNKNSKTNKCWYVDYDNGLNPIEDYNYILTAKQIKRQSILDILCKYYDWLELEDIDLKEAQEIEETKDYINQKYKPLDIYKKNVDKTFTVEYLERLESEGLQQAGTRHNSLFNLSRYYKYLGLSLDECKDQLKQWMNEQDTRTYTTPLKECYDDINKIVKYIYDNDIGLVVERKDIEITYSEMLQIMNLKSKNEKLVAYSMLIHSKRFSDNKGVFYMSFPQMQKTTNLGIATVKRIVPKLENVMIEYIERNQIVYDKNKFITKKPNKYKMLIHIEDNKINDKVYTLNNESNDLYNSYNECILELFNLNELKVLCTKNQYYEFVNLSNI
ncbi:TOTE conflict system archaeo-eukaryotic primase domain-containing protein [Priestia megaterium]|uniref:TOTE conflict system archaeo-eukaryotic primase domain-containing protein n=1 Tax=Priestia megaterium TaxID=1404 RepID=UPI003CC641B7